MSSASGAERKPRASSCKDGHQELSLSWCLAHLSKPKHHRDHKRSHMAQWRALVAIRTHHIKGHRSSISQFRRQGGLEPLLGLIRQTDCSRKTLDLALSILGNCCTERETCSEVRRLDGISAVVEVMKKHVAQLSVQNRAARVLGNLAMDPHNSALIHAAGGVPLLLLCVSQSTSASSPSSSSSSPSHCTPALPPTSASPTAPPSASPSASPCPSVPPTASSSSSSPASTIDSSSSPPSTSSLASSTSPPPPFSSPALECAQSAARALLYLSDSQGHRASLVSQGAVASLCPLTAPDLPLPLRRASLRALHELTRGCSVDCARQLMRCGGLPQLGAAASEEHDERALEDLALKTLANVCSQGCLRPLVGSLDVIKKFAAEVKKDALKSGVFLRALCLCCKEAVNRAKVKECGGLELLTGFLSTHKNHPLSRCVIQACVDFVFDESAVEQFLDLGLVPLLVERLVRLSKGEEPGCASNVPPPDLLPQGALDSYDFPPPEEKREQTLCSSSFLSLRSWLLSEGLISSEGDLLDSSSSAESDWSALPLSSPPQTTPTACSHKPSLSPVTSSTPKPLPPPPPQRSSSPPGSTPVKAPSSPTKFRLCSPLRRRQTRDKANVLRLTLETPPTASATRPPSYHPYHPEPWTPESPLLLLLSRFSHVQDPSAALASTPSVCGLLLYLTSHADPSARCFRMMLRLSENPNCLQALVRAGAAALIRLQLCEEREDHEERAERRDRAQDKQSPRVRAKVRQLGLSLLTNLQLQCESGFGSGVLSHVMCSGSDCDRLHCALSLPLITSNRALLRRLLLDGGGLQFALQPLGADTDSSHSEENLDLPLRTLYCPLLVGCLSALTVNSKPTNKSNPEQTPPPPAKRPRLDQSQCPYSSAAFDLTFLLDGGAEIPANRSAVSGGTREDEDSFHRGSDYFRVLLRGGFGEATDGKTAIPIRDVSPAMLSPVLHFLHGCRHGNGRDRGRCQALEAVLGSGLNRESFEKSALGQAMIGACRFLVEDLQQELEEAALALLDPVNCSEIRQDGRTQDENAEREVDFEGTAEARKGTDVTKAKDEANRAEFKSSVNKQKLTDTMEAKMADFQSDAEKRKHKDATEANKVDFEHYAKRKKRLDATEAEDKATTPCFENNAKRHKGTDTTDTKDDANKAKSIKPNNKDATFAWETGSHCASILDLLPELYWFSQRYSYRKLGVACLLALTGRSFSQAKAGRCLRQVVSAADSVDELRRDLLALATDALG